MIGNVFSGNFASENGLAFQIFNCSGVILIKNNKFLNNYVWSTTQPLGSTIALNNPGDISIINSIFENNSGIFGTCIYYSEESNT